MKVRPQKKEQMSFYQPVF